MCDVDRLSARREQHSLKFAQSLPKCSRTTKLLPPCRGRYMVGNWGTTPNSPSLVLALIDMLVVQSHIMWSSSTANSHNWTSCFLFSSLLACFTVWPCFPVVYCCTFSFVSGHTVGFFFFFLPSSLILYIVIRPLDRDFVQIKSYHIISYQFCGFYLKIT